MSSFASAGGWLGIGHGVLLSYLLTGRNAPVRSVYSGALLGSVSELIINYNIARINNFTSGKSSLLINYSSVGTAYGIYLSGILNFFDEPSPIPFAGTTLLTTGLGYTIGAVMSNTQNYTPGDVRIKMNAWLLGTVLPVSILVLIENEEANAYRASMALVGLGGLILGNELVRGYDFESSQGTFNTLATLGGGLVGAGIGLLISSKEGSNYKIIPLISTLGGGLGYYLTYSMYRKSTKLESKTSDLNIEFNPSGFFLGNVLKTKEPIIMPILNLRYRF